MIQCQRLWDFPSLSPSPSALILPDSTSRTRLISPSPHWNTSEETFSFPTYFISDEWPEICDWLLIFLLRYIHPSQQQVLYFESFLFLSVFLAAWAEPTFLLAHAYRLLTCTPPVHSVRSCWAISFKSKTIKVSLPYLGPANGFHLLVR